MGKSLKNAASPDEACEQYGCDTFRLYEHVHGAARRLQTRETQDIVGADIRYFGELLRINLAPVEWRL
jgi:leucyl-tRNA synthetase